MRLLSFFIVLTQQLISQNNLITIDERHKDVGTLERIYKVKVDFIIQNHQVKNLYLLRADAAKGITIQVSKKTIKPNDTTLIVVEFIPQKIGKFNETVNLITSADGVPFSFSLSGIINSIKTDDKTACFYFKKPAITKAPTTEPIVVIENKQPKDISNKIPDNTVKQEEKKLPVIIEPKENKIDKDAVVLEERLYKPNNIIFLVDVSNSMKDSLKLPVMKQALYYLIETLRPIDKITFITYADSVKTLKDGVSAANKKELIDIVDKLKAKGLTRGNKAILHSLDVALKNYIANGNNQIMMATDGKFRFYPEDQQKFKQLQGDKNIKLTTIGFGDEREAMKNLKEIAKIGKGNFIHIKHKEKAKQQLLDEVKEQSLIK